MSLPDVMLEQLGIARRIVEDGHEVVPMWRITTPEGSYLVATRFRTDNEEERERALFLITRFMVWKMATSFVLTVETYLGAEVTRSDGEAILVVGVSRHDRLAVMRKILRDNPVDFHAVERLQPEQVDEAYFDLLPSKASEITIEEIAELTRIFGEDGEMAAERLS